MPQPAAPPALHPAPPSLQHAPSSHPQSNVTAVTGPPSLQAAPHVRPPMSVPQSAAGPPGMQQGPPGMQQGPPGMQQGPQGIPVSHPGLPPGHPLQNHPGFPRHLIPGMMQQRPEHGFPLMQRPGFPPMEHMQGMMSRPPMLPHWSAPRQEFLMTGGPPRRGPRPSLPSMTALARMGMPHLSMRQGAPHSTGGPFPTSSSNIPVTSGEALQGTTVGQEDPSHATIPAGIPRSSPETSSVQSGGPVSNLPMQVHSGTEAAVSPVIDIGAVIPKEKARQSPGISQSVVAPASADQSSNAGTTDSSTDKQETNSVELPSEPQSGSQSERNECTDGVHCGTPPPQECTDGVHCGTPPSQECTDGVHCGTPPPQECTDGVHCGTPPPQECADGLHCGTPPPQECTDGVHCGTPPPQECTDGLHCGTPPPQECTDGLHCGTPPPRVCADGVHCGTPPPQECADGVHCGTPPPQECTDGVHCGTPPPQECTDGLHCGTPPPYKCTDGLHCGTPPPQECTDGVHCGTPPPQECADGLHCGTPPPQDCTDGLHCGTPPPQECTDGIHCGTPPPQECADGLHCGTPPPQECTDGVHCGTPPPQEFTDGIHCGTPPPQDCADGLHCGTPPPQECTDGLHCGTPPPQECTDGLHCGTPPPQECTDGLHCGTPPPQECTDGLHCGTPPPQECTDGLHCGTPPPQECTDGVHCGTPPPQECTDGLHCGTPPPQECTDGLHCGTPPPQEQGDNESQSSSSQQQSSTQPPPPSSSSSDQNLSVITTHDAPPSLQPVLLSPQQLAVQADHQYVNVSQPPVLLPSNSTEQEPLEKSTTSTDTPLPASHTETSLTLSEQSISSVTERTDTESLEKAPVPAVTSDTHVSEVKEEDIPGPEKPERKSPTELTKDHPAIQMATTDMVFAQEASVVAKQPESAPQAKSVQDAPVTQHQETMQEPATEKVVQVKETETIQNKTETIVPQMPLFEDVKEKQRPPTPVTELVSSVSESVKQEARGSSQLSSETEMKVDLAETKQPSETLKTETHKSVPDDSSHMQAIAKPAEEASQSQTIARPAVEASQSQTVATPTVEASQSQTAAVIFKVKEADNVDQRKTPVTTLEEKVAVSDSQDASSVTVKPVPSAAEIEAASKPPVASEVTTEEQPTPPVSVSAAHLSAIPRPRHFAPVGNIEEMQRQMFAGQVPGRPPYPGPVSGRYPSHPQDFRQQGYPPVSQPPGQQRQPQPAHFHESQLRFMQMYQHQLAQGQRPQAAHQSMQQFQPGQHPYPGPHGFRGPIAGQPGFPPHFYPQHPNMAGSRQQLPISTQSVPVPDQVTVSRSKSTSPKDQNLQRLPLSQSSPAGQMRQPGPAITPEPGPRPLGPSEHMRPPAPQVSSEHGATSGVSSEQAARLSSTVLMSESTSAHSTSVVTSDQPPVGVPTEHAIRHPPPDPASEHEARHPPPGPTSEHEARHPAPGPASGMPVRQLGPGIHPEFAARFQGPHRYPHPGFPPEHAVRYPHPGIASKPTTRPPGPWTHTEVRVRYPGPGMPPEARPRHPAVYSESPARQPVPGMVPGSVARHPTPTLTSESAVSHSSAASESAVRQSSPASASEHVDKSSLVSKSHIQGAESHVLVKEEPVDYQQSSCMSHSNKPSLPSPGPQVPLQQQESQQGKEKTTAGVPTALPTSVTEGAPTSATGTTESVAIPRSSSESHPPPIVQIKSEPGASEAAQHPTSVLPGPQMSTPSTSQPQEAAPSSVPVVSSAEHQQHVSSIPRPLSGHRQSPGHSQGQGPDALAQLTSELTLPSVSATFAAAGMMRYGENMQPGLPPYTQGHYRLHHPSVPLSSSHGPGFSSVSSIVQSVSSVSFPNLSGTPAQHHLPVSVPPAEVSLPPSTGVSSEAVSSVGASASTQTPVHHKVGQHPGMVPGHSAASVASTEQAQTDSRPSSAGSSVPTSQGPRPGHPFPDAQGPPGAPGMPGPHGPRMPVPPHSAAPQPTTQPGHVPRPRGPRQPRHDINQAAAMARFPRVPSNLPPHLAGMLNNMRGPMPPARHMYPQERHPGMPPMGPMRFPQGPGMMPMGPGGFRMPVSQDGSPMPMVSEGQMQVPMGAARHPGMMPQGMVMRPGMRMVGPGGPMMGPHPMQPPHPGPISPSGHPGAPPTHMHQRMVHPTTASGPLMGPPGMPQPSGHPSPKESQSPTQGMPPRPPTPGSVPSTPSPTSFHPGMMPMTSAPTMAPGLPGEMHPRHRFPGHRMRMPFDGRMPFDANMTMAPRMQGMEGFQRPPGFPPDGHVPGIPQIRPGYPETSQSPAGPFEDPLKRMDGGKPGPAPTPPQPGSKSATPPVGSETNSASTTPPTPGVNIKQEQNIGGLFSAVVPTS